MKDLISQYKKARSASTPLMAISTPDMSATIQAIVQSTGSNGSSNVPLIQWDCICGAQGINAAGDKAIRSACPEGTRPEDLTNPVEILMSAQSLEDKSVLFVLNGHQYFQQPTFVQALWNLRDPYKAKKCAVVLMGPSFSLPPELQQDILVIDEPLPDATQLRTIVQTMIDSNGVEGITETTVDKAVDALRGLAAFSAEQVTAMSLSKNGIDLEGVWERKRQLIDATPGLSVYRPKPEDPQGFDDLGGVSQAKLFLRRLIAGRLAPKVVVFLDEIEKALAGATGIGDSSGVSQGQHEVLLTYMQNERSSGMILLGPPGSAKSAIAKLVGIEAGIPTIVLDLNGLKGSLVGESEQRMRHAMSVIRAVGDGRALFIATCNKLSGLSPELKRRFKRGTFFFDLPTAEERATIWDIYIRRYKLSREQTACAVDDAGWTGAEIESACEMAYDFSCPISEAASYIVPVARSAADAIERLRAEADGKFLSASKPGPYEKPVKFANRTTQVRQLQEV